MEFNYIFQTGAGWAGPIGSAELVVNLPYPASPKTIVSMPEGGKVNGQQVRWIWENLEPGPDDDFRISLMQPERWEALQADQVAVKARPKDGQAWLKLCKTYYGLSYIRWHKIPGFGEVYAPLGLEACQEAAHLLPKSTHSDGLAWLDLCATYYRLSEGETSDPLLAVQACQEAARLLPTDAAPHYGLAVLYLSKLSNNPSPAKLQPVLDELKIGQELEAAQPPSNQVSYFLPLLGLDDDSPSEYITNWVNRISNIPKATAEQPIKTAPPKATLRVTVRNTLTPQTSPTSTPTLKLTLTPTSIPSETSQPLPTPTAQEFATLVPPASAPRGSMTGIGLGVVAAGVMLIGIVVFLVLKRR